LDVVFGTQKHLAAWNDLIFRLLSRSQNLAFPVGKEKSSSEEKYPSCAPWFEPGAVLLIDEAQILFPRFRKASEEPCRFIKYFQVHRHFRHDIYLITLDPMLIDIDARERFTGEHIKITNVFGLNFSLLTFFEHYVPPDDKRTKPRSKKLMFYKKFSRFFPIYNSTVDGKVEKKEKNVPILLYVLMIIGLLMILSPFFIYSSMSNFLSTDGELSDIENIESIEQNKEENLASKPKSPKSIEPYKWKYFLKGTTIIGNYKSASIIRFDEDCFSEEESLKLGERWDELRIIRIKPRKINIKTERGHATLRLKMNIQCKKKTKRRSSQKSKPPLFTDLFK
jgi:hypothetical protein